MMNLILRFAAVAVCVVFICFPRAVAQERHDVSTDKAGEYFRNGDWGKAAEAYRMITASQPENASAWFRLGYALHAGGNYDSAIAAYQEVLQLSPAAMGTLVMYNLGCAFALKGDREKSLEWLRKAADAGFSQVKQIRSDADLTSVKSDKRFNAIVAVVDSNAHPCAYEPRASDLDFWVGEWNVYNKAGQLAGTSRIERILDDCVISENWAGAFGRFGKSYSTYGPTIGKWRQTWVDDKGRTLLFEGKMDDSSMVFELLTSDTTANAPITRMTLTPQSDGRVRQVSCSSGDGGRTWKVAYDFLYVPKDSDKD